MAAYRQITNYPAKSAPLGQVVDEGLSAPKRISLRRSDLCGKPKIQPDAKQCISLPNNLELNIAEVTFCVETIKWPEQQA